MVTILQGDALEKLREMPPDSINMCVTSPPYFGLRDYGSEGQIGLERTPAEYVSKLVEVFEEVRSVLKDDGTLWLNLGDSYAGSWGAQSREHAGKHAPNISALSANQVKAAAIRTNGTGSLGRTPGLKAKDLIGIPWRVAFALQAAGWWLREDIIWNKPNCMPESVRDRCTRSHEYIFHLSKSAAYYHDADAIAEPGSMESIARYERGRSDNHKYANGGPGDQTIGRTLKHMADKQRGHSRRHEGFNARWDAMDKETQCGGSRNKRSVWTIAPATYAEAHFATFPPDLIRPCILAGCPTGGTVLDPFGGSGTTGEVAEQEGRHSVLIELNPEYVELARRRTAQLGLLHSA